MKNCLPQFLGGHLTHTPSFSKSLGVLMVYMQVFLYNLNIFGCLNLWVSSFCSLSLSWLKLCTSCWLICVTRLSVIMFLKFSCVALLFWWNLKVLYVFFFFWVSWVIYGLVVGIYMPYFSWILRFVGFLSFSTKCKVSKV